MDINMMHIGLDLHLQSLNSSMFGKLQHEEKDYWLNTVTKELVKAAMLNEKNEVFSLVTYQDLRKYYQHLQVYMRERKLSFTDVVGEGYVECELPVNVEEDSITSGKLYDGVYYKVISAGSTPIDLSDFGYSNTVTAGIIFKCDISEEISTIHIVSGETYRIVNADTIDFTAYGAPNNNVGTEFIANTTATVSGSSSTIIKPLAKSPSWTGNAELIPVYNIGFYLSVNSTTDITTGDVITTFDFNKGYKYVITNTGSTDFSSIGGVANPDLNYVFSCTTDDTSGTVFTGGTKVYKLKNVGNRLPKLQDLKLVLDNSFGSMKSSPVSVFIDNKLRVYHQNKFNIYGVYLNYIIKPIDVIWNKVNSDLPESLHEDLVLLTARRIAAVSSNPNYNAIYNETKDKE